MEESPQISLVLPAYNEAGSIASTIGEMVDYFRATNLHYEIIVAADGSDGTREKVADLQKRDAAIQVFGSPDRRGKGRGVREAVLRSTGAIVGYADADNKVPISELGKILPWFEQGHRIVIGSRALGASKIERRQPAYRRLGSVGFHFVMRALVGLHQISDTQCGFKFFERGVALRLFNHQKIDGYMFDVEILSLAQRMGLEVKEVPIRWRDDGDSRLDLVAGNLRNVKDLLRISLSRRTSAPEAASLENRRAD